MSTKVVRIEDARPSPAVLEELEEFVEMAKQGKLVGCAMVAIDVNHNFHTRFVNGSERSGISDLAAGVTLLQHKIMNWWLGK